jgi:hypothetical protein
MIQTSSGRVLNTWRTFQDAQVAGAVFHVDLRLICYVSADDTGTAIALHNGHWYYTVEQTSVVLDAIAELNSL